MDNLKDIPKIKKLADKFGNPMDNVEFIGEGVVFTYKVGGTTSSYRYSNTQRGIQEEIERFTRLLKTEIK